MICISCGRTDRHRRPSDEEQLSWLRSDQAGGLGVCSQCNEAVGAWDKGARNVRTLNELKQQTEDEGDPMGRLIERAKLPSLPHILIEIYQELESQVAGIDRMIQLLETDPGLTSRALQLGNSAYYGSSKKISQVADAILRVGPFDLWALLISTEVKSLFYGISPNLIDMNGFWRHSLFTACASRKLAEARGLPSPGDLFIAGLIHDIGKLILLHQVPHEYTEIAALQMAGDQLCPLEEEKLGLNHAELGGRLLETWSFPDTLIQLTADHHKSDTTFEGLMLLRQADRLAHYYLTDCNDPDMADMPPDAVVSPIVNLYGRLTDLVL